MNNQMEILKIFKQLMENGENKTGFVLEDNRLIKATPNLNLV